MTVFKVLRHPSCAIVGKGQLITFFVSYVYNKQEGNSNLDCVLRTAVVAMSDEEGPPTWAKGLSAENF